MAQGETLFAYFEWTLSAEGRSFVAGTVKYHGPGIVRV